MAKLSREELLILLIEECGEVIQAATKCLRFGFDSDHRVNGYGRNDHALSRELGEVAAVCDALRLDRDIAEQSFKTKIQRAEAAKDKYGCVVSSQERITEATGKRPFPSVSPNSEGEQQRDTSGVTAGETARSLHDRQGG